MLQRNSCSAWATQYNGVFGGSVKYDHCDMPVCWVENEIVNFSIQKHPVWKHN